MSFVKQNILAFNESSDRGEKQRLLIFLCLIFSLPFNIAYSSVLFLGFLSATLFGTTLEKIKKTPKQIWFFQIIYFLGVIGFGFSLHKKEASDILLRQISILLLPFFIPLAFNPTKDRAQLAVNILSIASLTCIFTLFMRLLILLYELELPLSAINSGAFFHHEFSKSIPIHSVYLSLYVVLSLINFFYLFYIHKNLVLRIFLLLGILLLLGGLIFLSSRNAFFSLLAVTAFLFPFIVLKKRKVYFFVLFVLLFGLILLFKRTPYLQQVFSVQVLSEFNPKGSNEYIVFHSAEPRIERWKSSFDLIKKSLLFGYGTGDEKSTLKTAYAKHGLFISYIKTFDAHNQYISYLIKNGITGLVLFLFAMYYYIKIAMRNKDFIYTSFLVILLIGFLSENILDANKGIFFFSIFNSLFGLSLLKNEPSKTPD